MCKDSDGMKLGLTAAFKWFFGTDEAMKRERPQKDHAQLAASIDKMGDEAMKLKREIKSHFAESVDRLGRDF